MMEERREQLWHTENYYQPPSGLPYAILILNQALTTSNVTHIKFLWQNACVRMCVDGGTNGYHKLMRCNGEDSSSHSSSPLSHSLLSNDAAVRKNEMQTYNVALTHNEPLSSSNTEVNDILPPSASCPYPSSPLPDLISGDFDSIHPELLKLYESLGVTIVPTPDQNETDFTKAVKVLARYIEEREIKIGHVLVVTGIHSDRFDHVMANLATLYKVRSIIKTPVILLSGGSMVWVLEEGKHRVEVSWQLIKNPNVSWCGLIPLGHPATVSTTGLKWNLADQMLEFGTLVSTSNTYDPTHHGQIYITTSHPCLWTMGWETRGTDVEMDG